MRMNPRGETKQTKRLTMLEAALYAAGRPVEIENLKHMVRTRSDRVVLKLVRELAKRYQARGGALEIKELPGNRVIMQLKTEFNKMVRSFTRRPLLSRGPMRTLSYIAYNQPVDQMKVVADRGSHVYNHLKMMEEMGLISRERLEGREVIIKTTSYFADYFGFSQNPFKARLQLRQIFSRIKITKLNNGDEEVRLEELMTMPSLQAEVLADAGDGLPKGLAEYPRPAN